MRRGTTPTLTFKVPGHDLTAMTLYLAFKQKGHDVHVKTGTALTASYDAEADETIIECSFTQEETLAFSTGNIEIQLRATENGGITAIASHIVSVDIKRILQEGVLE